MGSSKRYNRYTKVKSGRKGVGGRGKRSATNSAADPEPPPENAECSRERKIISEPDEEDIQDENNYNVLINFKVLKDIFDNQRTCKDCGSTNITISDDLSCRMGFCHKLEFTCTSCNFVSSKFTSQEIVNNERGKQGRNQFEVNLRSVLSFREIGKGHDTIKTFSRCMNMYSISEPSYRKINEKLHETYELVANESMKKAAFEARGEENAPDVYSARISIDGTWQRRGHSSLNGVVTIISGGKCIDSMVMSKRCRGCAVWERKQGTAAYNAWKATHICRINHTKSSGAMESNGAVEMFHRSVEKNRLVYHEYLGDGDSSSFKDVVESKPYEAEFGITPNKLECVGHVNKRMGSRLRNLVKDHKGTERPLGGKQGKLTQKAINSMTNYYGRAIRYNVRTGNTNKEKVYGMKKWIAAILHHCTDFKNVQKRHMYCPPGEDSWCKFSKC